jgi:hypothetical protein
VLIHEASGPTCSTTTGTSPACRVRRIIDPMRRTVRIGSVLLIVVSIVGLSTSDWILNAFVGKYNAYGEVPIPGNATLHLPEGEVMVSFHTEMVGTMEGGALPIPPGLEVAIAPPSGVAEPKFVQKLGGTTADNQDAHIQVGAVHIPVTADYAIKTNGKATAFLSPRLAFGHTSGYGFLSDGFLLGLFGVLLATGVLGLLASALKPPPHQPVGPPKPETPLQQLKTIASLHDSGVLTDEEYEAEKRRVLDDL